MSKMDDNITENNDIESIIVSEVERHNDSQNVSETTTSSPNATMTGVHVTPTGNNSSTTEETATNKRHVN